MFDVHGVQQANILKFSKLDDIVTPVRLLELFLDDVLIDMIIGYTNLYSHRGKVDIGLEITNEKIRLLLSMLLLGGCKFPDHKMHWETTSDSFV